MAFSQRYFLMMLHVHNVVPRRVTQTLRRVTVLCRSILTLNHLRSASFGEAGSPDCWHASGVPSFDYGAGDSSELQKRRIDSRTFAARVRWNRLDAN